MIDQREFEAHAERTQQLVERVNTTLDADARDLALDLLQSVMDLHGSAIARIVDLLNSSGESGRAALARLGCDPLVCGLLVLHGAHPLALEARVADALDRARPQLRKKGGTVELLGIVDETVRLKLQTTGHGCGSNAEALKQMIEQAVLEVAPEMTRISLEGLPTAVAGFVPLATLQRTKDEEQSYEESAA